MSTRKVVPQHRDRKPNQNAQPNQCDRRWPLPYIVKCRGQRRQHADGEARRRRRVERDGRQLGTLIVDQAPDPQGTGPRLTKGQRRAKKAGYPAGNAA